MQEAWNHFTTSDVLRTHLPLSYKETQNYINIVVQVFYILYRPVNVTPYFNKFPLKCVFVL